MGRPNLSNPCVNTSLWESSFLISVSEMKPFGTAVHLHSRYFRNRAEAFSTSRLRARRNLLSIRSSTSCIWHDEVIIFLSETAQGCRLVFGKKISGIMRKLIVEIHTLFRKENLISTRTKPYAIRKYKQLLALKLVCSLCFYRLEQT